MSPGVVQEAAELPAGATATSQAAAGRSVSISEVLGRVGLQHANSDPRTSTMTDDKMAVLALPEKGSDATFRLGKRLRGLRLEEAGVVILATQQRRLSFTEITAAAEIDNGFPFFSISLPTTDGSKVRVFGIKEGGVR
jgi:hypothetical protein